MSEAVLRDFHRRHAGRGHEIFGRARDGNGHTSHEILASAVPSTAERVLDLGCGDGSLLAILIARGHEGVGLDMSPEELACARERAPQAELHEGRAQSLPFESGSFDAVVSHMALMLMRDPDVVLREIARVVAPGGTFAAVVSGPDRSVARELVFSRVRELWAAEGRDERFGDPRTASEEGLRELLSPAFDEPAIDDFEVALEVDRSDIDGFLELSYYPVDLLGADSRRALAEFVASKRDVLAPDGTMTWAYGLRRLSTVRSTDARG